MSSRDPGPASVLPGSLLNPLRRIKHRTRRWLERRARREAMRVVREVTGNRVCTGPFPDLVLDARHVFGAAGAKLLGTYELELAPALRDIAARRPAVVIDVGGADGYFAVGFARCWHCPVIVFEALAEGRAIIACNATLNDVAEQVDIRGVCDEAGLHACIVEQPAPGFLMMDVEGAELNLLSDRVVAALGHWHVLVESHDFARPGCIEALEHRFAASHRLQRVRSRLRERKDFPLNVTLNPRRMFELMDEERPGTMTWLVAAPLETAHGKAVAEPAR